MRQTIEARIRRFVARPPVASLIHRIGRMPILGYGLKLLFALARLPQLESESKAIREAFANLLDNSSRHLSLLHSLRDLPERLRELERARKSAAIETVRLAAAFERFERTVGTGAGSALTERLATASRRIAELESAMRQVEAQVRARPEIADAAAESCAGPRPEAAFPPRTDHAGMQGFSGSIRLNLICAGRTLPRYLNVDARPREGVDLVADPAALPFEPGSVEEILTAFDLNGFSEREIEKTLLPHWRTLLKPGGSLRIEAAGNGSSCAVGFPQERLVNLLNDAGFAAETSLRAGSSGTGGVEGGIVARKPAA